MSKQNQTQDIQKTKQKTVTPPKQKMQTGKTAVIPSPDPESEDTPPQPQNALDKIMTAVQGDGPQGYVW